MTSEWEDRYEQKSEQNREIKEQLSIRLFGPYEGNCSSMLKEVAKILRKKEHFDAKICEASPTIDFKSTLKSSPKPEGPVFNLKASLDCISEADVCVFIFMDSDFWKFCGESNQFSNTNFKFDMPQLTPSDLNSSLVLEFDRWIRGPAHIEGGAVIYDNATNSQLGSLVRGAVHDGRIIADSVETYDQNDAIRKFADKIAGWSDHWLDIYNDRLRDRISEH